jgi:hypothetical protein
MCYQGMNVQLFIQMAKEAKTTHDQRSMKTVTAFWGKIRGS